MGRKLFLSHAGELAHLLVKAIDREGLVVQFIRTYAEKHRRPKITANTERLHEMATTISRESLLLISAEIHPLLRRALGTQPNRQSGDPEWTEIFYSEFLESLGRALDWPKSDIEAEAKAFARDLGIYSSWLERNPKLHAQGKLSDSAPFPDRCAILLDPAMMEQGRRAAALFQGDLLRLGAQIFGRLGRQTPGRPKASSTKAGAGSGTNQNRVPASGAKAERSRSKSAAKGTPKRH